MRRSKLFFGGITLREYLRANEDKLVENISIGSNPEEINSGQPLMPDGWGQMAQATCLEISVDFSGDPDIFDCKTRESTTVLPVGEIYNNKIVFIVKKADKETQIKERLETLQDYIDAANKEINEHNASYIIKT